jgi:pimeloyl-ACP methyl ester carboxylesterase
VPLVFFQHFMGNLDDHDSALTDAFAADCEVILFNNAGVASSTGTTPNTIGQAAHDAEAFIDALGLKTVDLLAHSMGGLIAQQVAFDRPELVRRLVLVGTAPRGGVGVGEMPPETQALFFKKYEHQEEMWLPILFSPSVASQAAGRAYLARMMARKDRDAEVSMETVQAQAAAIGAYGAEKDETYPPEGSASADPGRQRQQRHHHPDHQLLPAAAAHPQCAAHPLSRRQPWRPPPVSGAVCPTHQTLPRRVRSKKARRRPQAGAALKE